MRSGVDDVRTTRIVLASMPADAPLLRLTDLTVRRGLKTMLTGINLTVQAGENWVVMGPNGCGKTSLIRCLTGFLSPSAGEIELLGHRYGEADWRDVRRAISVVSSSLQAHIPAAEPALETVISGRYDQLDFWGTATPADRRVARAQLRRVGAADLVERPWTYLSQGERQRVLIARALAAEPQILILDEPCAGLDPVARQDFLDMVEALLREPDAPAVLLITHHVEEIRPVMTHALLLRAGRTVAAGPIRQTLGSSMMSTAFDRPLKLRRRRNRWHLATD